MMIVLLGMGAAAALQLRVPPLSLQIDATGEYELAVNGTRWWRSSGAGAAIKANGTFFTSGGSPRLIMSNLTRDMGSDELGEFERVSLVYTTPGVPVRMRVAFRSYLVLEAIVIAQSFPESWLPDASTVGGPLDDLSTSAFTVRESELPLTVLAFMGQQLQDTSLVAWPPRQQLNVPLPKKQSVAPFAGAPLVAYSRSGVGLVLGPLHNFFSSSCRPSAALGASIACGAHSAVSAVPRGWTHEVVLLARTSGAVAAVRAYGDLLLKVGGTKDRASAALAQARDIPISKLGYYTDNGAYYYYTTAAKSGEDDTSVGRSMRAISVDETSKTPADARAAGGACSVDKLDENTPNAGCETYERSLQLALDELR